MCRSLDALTEAVQLAHELENVCLVGEAIQHTSETFVAEDLDQISESEVCRHVDCDALIERRMPSLPIVEDFCLFQSKWTVNPVESGQGQE